MHATPHASRAHADHAATSLARCVPCARAHSFIVLPGAHSCYFARFFWSAELELLATHQTYSHAGRTYVAPFKRVHVDGEGTLRFVWWRANERLKGAEMPVQPDAQVDVQADAEPASKAPASSFVGTVNVSVGAVFEATVTSPAQPLPRASPPLLSLPGFLFELQTSGSPRGMASGMPLGDETAAKAGALIAVVDAAARVTLAFLNASTPPFAPPVLIETWDRQLRGMSAAEPMRLRVLYRRDMLEMYVNDVLLPVYLMPPSTGRVGLVPEAAGLVSGLRRWAMDLPGDGYPFREEKVADHASIEIRIL